MFNAQGGGNMWLMILMWGGLLVVFYFLLIRPNSKKQKREQEMRNNIKIGDEITTIGGIQGRIIAVKENEDAFVIETGPDRTKMKFKKWAISSNDTAAASEEQAKADKLQELKEKRAAKKAAKEAAKEEKNNQL